MDMTNIIHKLRLAGLVLETKHAKLVSFSRRLLPCALAASSRAETSSLQRVPSKRTLYQALGWRLGFHLTATALCAACAKADPTTLIGVRMVYCSCVVKLSFFAIDATFCQLSHLQTRRSLSHAANLSYVLSRTRQGRHAYAQQTSTCAFWSRSAPNQQRPMRDS